MIIFDHYIFEFIYIMLNQKKGVAYLKNYEALKGQNNFFRKCLKSDLKFSKNNFSSIITNLMKIEDNMIIFIEEEMY